MVYSYSPDLPKQVTLRAIALIYLRLNKPVYTTDRILYNELRESHPEFNNLLHFLEPNVEIK